MENAAQGGVLIIMGAILTTLTTVSLHYDHSPLALPLEVTTILLLVMEIVFLIVIVIDFVFLIAKLSLALSFW